MLCLISSLLLLFKNVFALFELESMIIPLSLLCLNWIKHCNLLFAIVVCGIRNMLRLSLIAISSVK